MSLHPLPRRSPGLSGDDLVVDLSARRAAADAAVRAAAAAPVRHVPAAFLAALQGSWGTAEDVLGVSASPVRLTAAR